ncbi:hypothetical protein ACIPYS_20990 [Kitasatospora sp. NPDC089913]|uniref:hypothetical protein n=1 Tax=Kitasatospora sp. NPDC089913 TaxID=3364080 RepID=UPI0038148E31
MPIEVRFHQLHPWALPPRRFEVDRRETREHAEVLRESFRFVRADRRPEHCAPWGMGQEPGWRVQSPVDVSLTPLDRTEPNSADEPEAAGRAVNRTELWQREKSHPAVEKISWLHLYRFRTERGWENTLLANGVGTVEWCLGWLAQIPLRPTAPLTLSRGRETARIVLPHADSLQARSPYGEPAQPGTEGEPRA